MKNAEPAWAFEREGCLGVEFKSLEVGFKIRGGILGLVVRQGVRFLGCNIDNPVFAAGDSHNRGRGERRRACYTDKVRSEETYGWRLQ